MGFFANIKVILDIVLLIIQFFVGHILKFTIYMLVPEKLKSLENDVVLITGAASGIGKLMAKKFAQQGAKLVVCWDLNTKGNDETVQDLIDNGYQAIGYHCDLSDREAVYKVADQTKTDVKRLTGSKDAHVSILVNNAGVVTGKKLLESSDRFNELSIKVNTLSHFWTTKAFLPTMLEKDHGHIVAISSVAGLTGNPGLVDYSASKYANVGFIEALYMEIKRNSSNVKCTLVCPFLIDTGMFTGMTNPYEWLVPTLQPDYVANQVLNAVRKNYYLVILPKVLCLVYVFKPILGFSMMFKLGRVLGMHQSMDTFTGRLNKQS